MNPAGTPTKVVAVITPAFTLPRVTFGAPAIVVAEPVTLPVKFPVNDVAVIIPAPASTPVALIVTAAPTMALPVVVTPVTTAPSGNSGDVPAVLPHKLVTLSVAIRDLRFEGHQ